jgi:phenylpropionate dioxygenase-like ring-hydroxylating dioxygenase large terminal subunit
VLSWERWHDWSSIHQAVAPNGLEKGGPAAALIYDDWYPALRSDLLRGNKLRTAMLLDLPLVLGRRSDGRIFAMRDSCPHRGIPLSVGWFDGEHVTCRYHGWEFEPCSGQCADIPSLSSFDKLDASRDLRRRLSLRRKGWLRLGVYSRPGAGRKKDIAEFPPVPELPKYSDKFRRASDRRPALQRGPRHHRPDGPGARPVCASGVVVAFARLDS